MINLVLHRVELSLQAGRVAGEADERGALICNVQREGRVDASFES